MGTSIGGFSGEDIPVAMRSCDSLFSQLCKYGSLSQAPSALRNLHPGPGVEAWGVRDTVSFEDSALGCQVPLLPCFQLNMPILMDKMLSTFGLRACDLEDMLFVLPIVCCAVLLASFCARVTMMPKQ